MESHNSTISGTFLPSARRATLEKVVSLRKKVMLDYFLPAMLEAIPDYALVLNQELQVLAANRSLLRTFGVAAIDSLLGKRPGEVMGCLFSSDSPDGCGTTKHCTTCGAVKAITASQQTGAQAVRECRITLDGNHGTALDLEVMSTPIEIQGIPLTVCVLKDISAEKRRSVLEMVFFHDVINTAGGIHGIAVQLAEGKWLEPGQETKYKQWMVDLSGRLIEEILDQRKLLAAEKGEFRPNLGMIAIADLMSEVHALCVNHNVAEERHLVLGPIPDDKIISDASILRRILVNLVKNALEATDKGGTVTISGEEANEEVTFSVHNPNVMPEEVQLQLFQRSFSTKATEGRGIGTYSAKLFGERYLKGKVSFVSREPEGTIFKFTVPKFIDSHPLGPQDP